MCAEWEGCVLNNSAIVAPPPFDHEPFYRMERPKIFKCPSTSSYRMVFHCDTSDFAMRSIGVLTAPAVTGPYTFAAPCFRPDGQDSYDMGTFFDDPVRGGDGGVYLIRSVRNQFAGISKMTADCLNVTGITSQGPDMEGQAIMRDTSGTLHAAGSHLTGWAANAAQFVTSPNASLVGAAWVDNYNPSGDPTTYDSQSTFIFPYVHPDGHTTFIWMADRWNANGPGGLDNMTNIWLPLVPPAPAPPTPPAPAAGWLVTLAACAAGDPLQAFTLRDDSTIVHAPSGLCVTQPANAGTPYGQLTLQPCGGGGAGEQAWYYVAGARAIANTTNGDGATCMEWNNANQIVAPGNPVIAWACGGGNGAWWATWGAPATGSASGPIAALGSDGAPSGDCAVVAPATAPTQWTLPYLSAWSLKDF